MSEILAADASLTARLGRFLVDRPGLWIDGRDLAPIGGAYAWRSRLSDLRRQPFNLRIDNRQRRVRGSDGVRYTVSEYAYVPEGPAPSCTT